MTERPTVDVMAIIVLRHSDVDGLGRLGEVLRSYAFVLDERRPDRDGAGAIPRDYDGVQGVISLGGPQNVGDQTEWLAVEQAYLRGAHERRVPVVGVCLGHQLIAAALGGEVGPAEAPEFGVSTVELSAAGQTDTVWAGVPWEAAVFQSHGHEVRRAPAGAAVLASSKACKVQAFRAGQRTYGFQAHIEVTPAGIEGYLAGEFGRGVCARLSLTEGDVRRAVAERADALARVSTRLCENIASFLFPPIKKLRP
ncbi:MAG: GMP synthase [Planctomyces sp.]|nr:GMP synthase [Planctomyces sp.]MBA4120347.1 GMP synthase [Isosphaera sp.]